MSKIQTLAFEEGVIDVLSKKVKIIRVRQVEPSIEYLESGKRKRLFKVLERHFLKTKYLVPNAMDSLDGMWPVTGGEKEQDRRLSPPEPE